MHDLKSVQENETHKVFSDFEMQTDHLISARRPDLMIVNKKEKKRELAEYWTLLSWQTTK